jgi:DNA (cytosine-5)-methyltransferase 1
LGWAVDAVPTLKNGSTIGIPSPPAVLMPDGRIVKPGLRDAERLQGFDADWTQPAEAVARTSARWSLVGSAVSVPVAQWLGERLASPSRYDEGRDGPFSTAGKAPRAARFDGKHRTSVAIGTDPLGQRPPPLTDFLTDVEGQQLLSAKATLGFLSRTRRAKLRFVPGFIAAVERHLQAMGGSVPGPERRSAQLDLLAA